jgi:signal transduction histidine kinase
VNNPVARLRPVGQGKPDVRAEMSHELRTPLTSIAGYVEMLREEQVGPLTPAQAAMLEAVDRNTARLRQAVEDVLAVSEIESGTFRTTRQPVNLVEVVAAAVEALRLHSPGEPVIVAGDPGQLGRLVMNLLSNSVTFTPGGGWITTGAEASGAVAVLTVRDSGIGIPAGQQPAVGTQFAQASTPAGRPVPGSGLVMARSIVANHAGELAVHSVEGRGTTVTARIPLLTAQGGGEPAREGEKLPSRRQAAGEGHAKPGQVNG